MRPPRVQVALLTRILVVGMVPVTLAHTTNQRPNATGVVATITALNRRTGMATLTAETGEVFVPPKDTRWPVGGRCAVSGWTSVSRGWTRRRAHSCGTVNRGSDGQSLWSGLGSLAVDTHAAGLAWWAPGGRYRGNLWALPLRCRTSTGRQRYDNDDDNR